jgi:hypothetical protein
MKFFKRYWFNIVFAFAIVAGAILAHISYETLIKGWSPYIIVDMGIPCESCPSKYEPVEITGLPVEQGVKRMVTCRVPVQYAPYVHYPDDWANSPFNPEGTVGQITKWGLYGILGVVVGLISWRIAIKAKNRKKIGGKSKK